MAQVHATADGTDSRRVRFERWLMTSTRDKSVGASSNLCQSVERQPHFARPVNAVVRGVNPLDMAQEIAIADLTCASAALPSTNRSLVDSSNGTGCPRDLVRPACTNRCMPRGESSRRPGRQSPDSPHEQTSWKDPFGRRPFRPLPNAVPRQAIWPPWCRPHVCDDEESAKLAAPRWRRLTSSMPATASR